VAENYFEYVKCEEPVTLWK